MGTPEVDQLLAAPDSELYAALGRAVDKSAADDDSAENAGEQYFRSNLPKFAQKICADPHVTALRRSYADSTTLVAAIADALSALAGLPAVLSISVLVLRYGLDKLCGSPTPLT
ncbi:hypothetical protein [Mycobacteroides franklinii]|uniref:hypothetical protein n=1 Tax=Mycobacteroides franklinii TaxID=948102 RepID=UPI0013E8AFDE|nr:hypothetical protein [Mycobacteroides franklinii]